MVRCRMQERIAGEEHLQRRKRANHLGIVDKISREYKNNSDEFSKDIILTHIDSILKYAQRFYKRQFINWKVLSGSMVSKFSDILSSHLKSAYYSKKDYQR